MSGDGADVLEVTVQVTVEDYVALNVRHANTPFRVALNFTLVAVLFGIPAAALWGLQLLTGKPPNIAWLVMLAASMISGLLLIWVLLLLLDRFLIAVYARAMVRRSPEFIGERRIALTPEGIGYDGATGHGLVRWPWVRKIVATRDHVFLYISAINAFIVPRRDCASEAEFAEFAARARRLQTQAKAGASIAPEHKAWLGQTRASGPPEPPVDERIRP
jgi:hypothetical protein